MSFIHGLIFVPASTVVRPTSILLIATAFSLPFNLVLFGIENLVFALYPNRLMQTTPGDLQQVGVQFTHILMKSLLFGMAAAPVALLGTIAWLAVGPWLAMPVMWLTAVGVAGGFVILVARAFDRFDPSLDSPP